MQPILAESPPHRGRAVAFAVVLAAVASLAMIPRYYRPHRPDLSAHHEHHRLAHGKCTYGYLYLTH